MTTRTAHSFLLLIVLTLAATAVSALAACGGQGGSVAPPAGAEVAGPTGAPQLTGGGLPAGCRCHSKVKWQVAMHKLFSPQDCMQCHSENENLMAPGSTTMTAAHLDQLKQRMLREPVCLQCHTKAGTSVPSRFSTMKGGLYCPTDGKLYGRDQARAKGNAYFCPVDGTKLVDVDAVTAASQKQPSNKYCVACHQKTPELDAKHSGVAQASGTSDLSDCLSCHPGHSQCDSCHH